VSDRRDEALEPAPAAEDRAESGETPARAAEAEATGLAAGEGTVPATDAHAALRNECEALREQLLRRRAEFDNYRKRVERDRNAAREEALAELIGKLLPVLDDLDRALEAAAATDPLREGVEIIRRTLLGQLESEGVTVEDPLGQPFDPRRHQALAHEPAPGQAEGAVVEVYRKGYFLRERLLRPALVKVAKAVEPGFEPEAVH